MCAGLAFGLAWKQQTRGCSGSGLPWAGWPLRFGLCFGDGCGGWGESCFAVRRNQIGRCVVVVVFVLSGMGASGSVSWRVQCDTRSHTTNEADVVVRAGREGRPIASQPASQPGQQTHPPLLETLTTSDSLSFHFRPLSIKGANAIGLAARTGSGPEARAVYASCSLEPGAHSHARRAAAECPRGQQTHTYAYTTLASPAANPIPTRARATGVRFSALAQQLDARPQLSGPRNSGPHRARRRPQSRAPPTVSRAKPISSRLVV